MILKDLRDAARQALAGFDMQKLVRSMRVGLGSCAAMRCGARLPVPTISNLVELLLDK